jgi:hypothetical protein
MILSPSLISDCVTHAQKEKSDALWISEIILGQSFFAQCRRFERSFYDGTCIDGVRFIKKSALVAVNGFDPNFAGPEDWDLDKKLKKQKYKLTLLPAAPISKVSSWSLAPFIQNRGVNPQNYGGVIYHNESAFTLKKYLSKKKYYTQSFPAYIAKWGANDPEIKKQFGFYYRYFGVFIENGNWKKLLAHPILTLGMYFLRLLVGLNYLRQKATS